MVKISENKFYYIKNTDVKEKEYNYYCRKKSLNALNVRLWAYNENMYLITSYLFGDFTAINLSDNSIKEFKYWDNVQPISIIYINHKDLKRSKIEDIKQYSYFKHLVTLDEDKNNIYIKISDELSFNLYDQLYYKNSDFVIYSDDIIEIEVNEISYRHQLSLSIDIIKECIDEAYRENTIYNEEKEYEEVGGNELSGMIRLLKHFKNTEKFYSFDIDKAIKEVEGYL